MNHDLCLDFLLGAALLQAAACHHLASKHAVANVAVQAHKLVTLGKATAAQQASLEVAMHDRLGDAVTAGAVLLKDLMGLQQQHTQGKGHHVSKPNAGVLLLAK